MFHKDRKIMSNFEGSGVMVLFLRKSRRSKFYSMKHLKIIIAALLVLPALFACKKEEEATTYVKLAEVDMYLTPDSTPVKDTDGSKLLTPSFAAGDKARMIFGTSRNEPFDCTREGSASLFKYDGAGSYAETSKKTITNFFKAVYPSSITASNYAEDITLTIPSKPAGASTVTKEMNVMIGRSKTENVQMHNAVSFIKFKVAHEGITAVSFTANSTTEKLSGLVRFTFNEKSGEPEISVKESASRSLTVYSPDETFMPGKYYYAAVLPCDLKSCGYSILYQTNGGYYSVGTSSASSAFTIGNVYTVPETDAKATLIKASAGFTASADGEIVFFAQGNLQYDQSKGRWQIAAHQYDVLGNASGIVDLFSWSTENSAWGMSGDTSGAFKDWGNNIIYGADGNPNGAGIWFTPTQENYRYILRGRSASTVCGVENACYAKMTVAGVPGILLFPDVFIWPLDLDFPEGINSYNAKFSQNSYSAEEFAVLEVKGAIFLPAAGYKEGGVVSGVGTHGYYWTSTGAPLETSAYGLDFSVDNAAINAFRRGQGYSVRLVSTVFNE